MNIANLGAAAGGLAQGARLGLDMADRIDERKWRDEQRERLRTQQQRQDADTAALDAANMEAQKVIQRYQQEWQKQLPGPTENGAPVAKNPFQITPAMVLEAGKARSDKLLQLGGPNETWMKAWAEDEGIRARIRAGAAQRVKQAVSMGGDPTNALGEFFGTMDDGYQVNAVTPAKGPDGKVMFTIARSNRFNGQPAEPITLPADQLLRELDAAAANPVDLAKHNLAMSLEAYRQAGNLTEIKARGEQERATAKEKHGYSLDEIDRRSAGAKEVAGIRRGGEGDKARAEAIRALAQERTSVDNDIRTLTQQAKDARPSERAGILTQLEEARVRAADIRRRLSELSAGQTGDTVVQGSPMDAVMRDAEQQGLSEFDVQLGGRPRMTVRRGGAAPASKPLTTLPQGAKRIGTSGGKPVYETPDGKRFIQE